MILSSVKDLCTVPFRSIWKTRSEQILAGTFKTGDTIKVTFNEQEGRLEIAPAVGKKKAKKEEESEEKPEEQNEEKD